MGCCGDSAEVQPIRVNGRELSTPQKGGEFAGPTKDRSCTDVLCLLLFVAFCIGGIIYLAVAYSQGDVDRLIHGYDSCGNVCGKNNSKIGNVGCSGQNKIYQSFNNILNQSCVPSCDASKTIPIAFQCVPINPTGDKTISDTIKEFFENLANNLRLSWREILATCFIGLILSIIVIVLLRFFAGVIVWVTVILIAVGSVVGTVALWIMWSQYQKQEYGKGLLAGAIISTIFTVLLLVLLISMRNRIRLVIQLFEEASKAVSSMPLLLLQPVWTLLVLIIVIGVWLGAWIPIQSSGKFVETSTSSARLEMDPVISGMRVYHIFGFLWVSQFILGCQCVTIAGAVATWYFTRDKNHLGYPIFISMGNLVRYHLGSVVFGALIIAIVKLIRLILKYIENKLGSENSAIKCLLRCCQCCLWCFENFLKFLNRNAYIQIAMFGYNFCQAAKKAFTILANNALRVGTLNFVGDFVLLLVQLVVVGLTVTAGYFILASNKSLNTVAPSLIVAGVITFFIVYCFVSVYEMTIDTLFLCFCEDCERNDGLEKPYFMSRGLMRFVENSNKAIEALDQREKDAKNNNSWKNEPINSIQIPPNYQHPSSPNTANSKVSHGGQSGMTPLHPAYPPVSTPPTPSNFMPPPAGN